MESNRRKRARLGRNDRSARRGRCPGPRGRNSRPRVLFSCVALMASLCATVAIAQEKVPDFHTFSHFDPFDEAKTNPPNVRFSASADSGLDFGPGYLHRLPVLSQQTLVNTPDPLPAWSDRDRMPRSDCWTWQLLPDGLIYPSYLAGTKESRFASVWNHDSHLGWMWDLEAGGRVGLFRYGTEGGSPRPNGWQLDLEGAAFPRLDLDHEEDLISVDFRAGIPLTFGYGPFQAKLAVYHLSSHLGDEFSLRFPDYPRINYSRDALVLGGSYYLTDDLRLYAEAEWAWYTDGGTKPWQFQFGIDYSPVWSSPACRGAPFLAINGQLREEVDYSGDFVVQAGWQWRSATNHLFRVGVQYFTGKSEQYQFFCRNEEKVGLGIWYDY